MAKKPPKVDRVKVHHTAGCQLCGRTDKHTHSAPNWDRHIREGKR